MFCSFAQTQLFVLTFCSVVFARRLDQGDAVTVPAQRPMLHFRPAASKEVVPESAKDVWALGRDATIKLFPPSPLAMRHSFSFGCKESQVNTITLRTDVCLSGDYYLNHNMLISEAPVCPDGSSPTMSYYPARGCVGEPQFESTTKPIPDYCLWGGIAPKYWSLIFRCGPDASTAQGADKHEAAIPPPAPELVPYKGEVRPGKEYDGIVTLRRECTDQHARLRGAASQYIVPVDICIITSESIKIKREAICPNGKRAQWARFESSDCNGGQISDKYSLVDIHDKDIDVEQCLSPDPPESEDKVRSVAFWCEGIKVEPSKQISMHPAVSGSQVGYYNLNACRGDKESKIRTEYITPAKPDTCNIRFRYPWKLSIAHPAICANGKKASLAVFKDLFCKSQPSIFPPVSDDKLNQCLTFDYMRSWAFWCDGEGLSISTPQLPISKPEFMKVKHVSSGELISIPKVEVQVLPPGTIDQPTKADTTRPALVGAPSFAIAKPAPPDAHLDHYPKLGPIHITSTKFRSPGSYSASACDANIKHLVLSSRPDTCNSISHPFMIHSPAHCTDDKLAVVALYKDGYCGGQPDQWGAVDVNSTNQCFEFEGMKSWTFWCNGGQLNGPFHKEIEVPEQIPSLHDIGSPRPARDPGASIEVVVGFYVIASLVILFGVWVWFGPLIVRLAHILFPWPFESSAKGEIVLGEDKV